MDELEVEIFGNWLLMRNLTLANAVSLACIHLLRESG